MFEYTKTIINGVKVWCRSEIDRVRKALEPLIAKAQKTANGAAKSVQTLNSTMQTELDMVYESIDVAANTANTAQSTANTAKSTANTAKSTANTAKSTAESGVYDTTGSAERDFSVPNESDIGNLKFVTSETPARDEIATFKFAYSDNPSSFYTYKPGLSIFDDCIEFSLSLSNNSIINCFIAYSDGASQHNVVFETAGIYLQTSSGTGTLYWGTLKQLDEKFLLDETKEKLLPPATASNAGKILQVSETGAWEAAENAALTELDAKANISNPEFTGSFILNRPIGIYYEPGLYSASFGDGCRATERSQFVVGRHNELGDFAFIAGNGTSSSARSNAHTLDWDGNAWFAGYVEGTALILKSTTAGSTKRFRITVDDTGTLSATEVT